MIAYALIAAELSTSCFETPYGKIGELLYRGDEVDLSSQFGCSFVAVCIMRSVFLHEAVPILFGKFG